MDRAENRLSCLPAFLLLTFFQARLGLRPRHTFRSDSIPHYSAIEHPSNLLELASELPRGTLHLALGPLHVIALVQLDLDVHVFKC